MTTREKEKKQESAGLHMDEVSEQTRTFAAWWIHRLKNTAKRHGYSWHEPNRVENCLGEVIYEWWGTKGVKRKLSVFVENQDATYLRFWDWDEQGRGGCMEEGECVWLDHGLLLWHWFTSPSS
jgi:hypothetical protein